MRRRPLAGTVSERRASHPSEYEAHTVVERGPVDVVHRRAADSVVALVWVGLNT